MFNDTMYIDPCRTCGCIPCQCLSTLSEVAAATQCPIQTILILADEGKKLHNAIWWHNYAELESEKNGL